MLALLNWNTHKLYPYGDAWSVLLICKQMTREEPAIVSRNSFVLLNIASYLAR
jgi:hypothetical protein